MRKKCGNQGICRKGLRPRHCGAAKYPRGVQQGLRPRQPSAEQRKMSAQRVWAPKAPTPLCGRPKAAPHFSFVPPSAVEVGALAGRPLGTLPRRSVEVGCLSCIFPALFPRSFRISVKSTHLHFFLHENMVSEALVVIFGIYAKNAAQRWGRELLGCPGSKFSGGFPKGALGARTHPAAHKRSERITNVICFRIKFSWDN